MLDSDVAPAANPTAVTIERSAARILLEASSLIAPALIKLLAKTMSDVSSSARSPTLTLLVMLIVFLLDMPAPETKPPLIPLALPFSWPFSVTSLCAETLMLVVLMCASLPILAVTVLLTFPSAAAPPPPTKDSCEASATL